MTESELFSILDSAMPGRVFTPIAPSGAIEPYLIYQDITTIPQNSMCGYALLDSVQWQLDSYARTRAEARRNMERVKLALRASDHEPTVQNEQSLYEVETRLNRRMVQITTWTGPEEVTA
ncbi:DUF3168 domain-containing protein [Paraburkholderia terrae]|uniref:DUF3168 domain-containing protein n=1 Tax=Paraburkholderia terrae TaxID=311230 RepID=A0A2I8EVR7_9BURK|nr:DUF3168 domain-containing protein [Paraburkholderia terrae]AUT62884.1 DUF3168 domain-containing protein [Paraburkholderia terrae]